MDLLRRIQVRGSKEQKIALGVAAGVSAGMFLWYAWNKTTHPIVFSRPSQQTWSSIKDLFHQFKESHLERVVQVKKAAIHEEKEEHFSKITLEKIQQLAFEVIEPEVKKTLKQNRDSRRKVVDSDLQKYEKIVVEGVAHLEKTYFEAVHAILAEIKQDFHKYEVSVDLHGQSEAHLSLKGSVLFHAIKKHLSSSNQTVDFNSELAKKVHEKLNEDYDKILHSPASHENFTIIREALLFDMLAKNLKLEEEDVNKLTDLYQSADIQRLQHALAVKVNEAETKHKAA